MKAIITAILIILLLIGCRNNSEQQSDTYFQRTGVSFTIGNEALQELFDSIALDSTTPGLTDPRDGNTYRIVKIGEQVWI